MPHNKINRSLLNLGVTSQPLPQSPLFSLAQGLDTGLQRSQQQANFQSQQQFQRDRVAQKAFEARQVREFQEGEARKRQTIKTEAEAKKIAGRVANSLKQTTPGERPAALKGFIQQLVKDGTIADEDDLKFFNSLSDESIIDQVIALETPINLPKLPIEETAFQREIGSQQAKKFTAIVEKGQLADSALLTLNRAEVLNKDPALQRGLITRPEVFLKELQGRFGNEKAAEVAAKLEEFQSIENKLAIDVLAAFTGAKSDFEFQVSKESVANLRATPQGRSQIIKAAKIVSNIDIKKAEFFQDYVQENGNTTGAGRQFRRFLKDNPPIAQSGKGKDVQFFETQGLNAPFEQYLTPGFSKKFVEQTDEQNDAELIKFAEEAIDAGADPAQVEQELNRLRGGV